MSEPGQEAEQARAVAFTLTGIAVIGGYFGLSLKFGPGFAVPVGILGAIGGTFLAVLAGPVGRAWARHIERSAAGGAGDELDQLHDRVAELEAGQARIAELEERLEFAERLLTKSSAAERLRSGDAE